MKDVSCFQRLRRCGRKYSVLLVLVLSVMLPSCLHNGGDIGIWYGTWNITAVEVDGVTLPQPQGYHFSLNFQSNIVELLKVTDRHDMNQMSYGNWEEEGERMRWTFGADFWPLPEVPGIDADNEFTIIERSAGKVRLKKVTEAGVTYVYTLKKLV